MAVPARQREEQIYTVALGSGVYTSELSSNIPDGFSPVVYNMIATGDSLENREGLGESTYLTWLRRDEAVQNRPSDDGVDDSYYFTMLNPWNNDSVSPAFAWGGAGIYTGSGTTAPKTITFVRAGQADSATDSSFDWEIPGRLTGMCMYNNAIYFTMGIATGAASGVQKVTSLTFASGGTLSYSQVASSTDVKLKGLFAFKDRLWAWSFGSASNRLYYTDLPTVGGLPETWAFAANMIPFNGPNGRGAIKAVIPTGNRLIVFTTNGMYSVLVEGAPGSWVLRLIDSKSISTTSQCAVETKGVVYYINTTGVWATNGVTFSKLSGVIEDKFIRTEKGAFVHCINHLEDGLVISIAKQRRASLTQYAKEKCFTFYSKLDPIAWTEFNINRYNTGTSTEQIAMIWSVSEKVSLYANSNPCSYCMVAMTNSSEATGATAVYQLLCFDGGEDIYRKFDSTVVIQDVDLYFKTKMFDGGNPYRLKKVKRALLEIFANDLNFSFTTSLDSDRTINDSTDLDQKTFSDSVIGLGSNMTIIKGLFAFRRAAFNFHSSLRNPTSQIKIKDLALVLEPARDVFEQVS